MIALNFNLPSSSVLPSRTVLVLPVAVAVIKTCGKGLDVAASMALISNLAMR